LLLTPREIAFSKQDFALNRWSLRRCRSPSSRSLQPLKRPVLGGGAEKDTRLVAFRICGFVCAAVTGQPTASAGSVVTYKVYFFG